MENQVDKEVVELVKKIVQEQTQKELTAFYEVFYFPVAFANIFSCHT